MRTAFTSFILALLISPAFGLTITSEAPGNLFTTDEKVVIKLTDIAEPATWKLTDLSGNKLKNGVIEFPYIIDLGTFIPGYYELTCSAGDSSAVAAIGIVASANSTKNSIGRVGVDVAMAWCIPKEQWQDSAAMVRMSGITWVRERIAWGGVEPGIGSFNWKNYDDVIDLLHSGPMKIPRDLCHRI